MSHLLLCNAQQSLEGKGMMLGYAHTKVNSNAVHNGKKELYQQSIPDWNRLQNCYNCHS